MQERCIQSISQAYIYDGCISHVAAVEICWCGRTFWFAQYILTVHHLLGFVSPEEPGIAESTDQHSYGGGSKGRLEQWCLRWEQLVAPPPFLLWNENICENKIGEPPQMLFGRSDGDISHIAVSSVEFLSDWSVIIALQGLSIWSCSKAFALPKFS